MQELQYTQASKASHLEQIMSLQGKNLEELLSSEEVASQGFVTLQHDLALLKKLAGPHRHIIALHGQELAGYALVMLKEFSEAFPILVPMFEKIGQIHYQGSPLASSAYFVMGQVCIDKPWRGKGIFAGLYQQMRQRLRASFEYCLTEVATRNARSIRAHEKAGFHTINIYEADGEEWAIMLWDWH